MTVPQASINRIEESARDRSLYTVPTLSTGFDSIPWHGARNGNISVEDFGKGLGWIRDTYLSKYSNRASWADGLIWLSTWNEYGEGTYIMPSGLNGFGYLDEIMNNLINRSKTMHTDLVPTTHQRERINHLYPQKSHMLFTDGWYFYNATNKEKNKIPDTCLFIDGVNMYESIDRKYRVHPLEENGAVYHAFNAATTIHYLFGGTYKWNRDSKTLVLTTPKHELVFRVGESIDKKDGVYTELGYTVKESYGLPMLDFALLAADLDFRCEQKEDDLYVYTK